MFRLASLILRNVFRNRRRTLLTLASTAVSLAVLGFLVALFQGFFMAEESSPSEALRLICSHKVSLANPLPASHYQRIVSVEGVEAASPWTWYQGRYIDDKPENFFPRFAVDPVAIRKVRPDFTAPDDQWEAFRITRTGCAVARKIMEKKGLKLGDTLFIKGDIYPVDLELKIVMVYDAPTNNEFLLFHREYLSELLRANGNRDADSVGTYLILAKTAQDVPRIARAIDDAFANSPWPTKTQSEREFSLSFMSFLGNIKMYLGVVCAAVTFTILLVCANTVAMSVRERTREMAILRTLGYTPGEIMQTVLGESALVAFLGGLVGIGLAYGLTRVMLIFNPYGEGIPFRWEAAVIVAGFSIVIGLLSAMVPAWFASRRNIVESLRFVG